MATSFASSAASLSSSFSSLSLLNPSETSFFSFKFSPISPQTRPKIPTISLSSFPSKTHQPTKLNASSNDIDTSFFENLNPEEEIPFVPVPPPEGYVPPPYFDEGPVEAEDETAAAYEEIYGPAYSGVSVLGNDPFLMDSKMKKVSGFGKRKKEKVRDGFDERVVQVRRVTKVVKGGKQMRFRAVVVVGDKKGQVGVGVGKAREVVAAVEKSATDARRNIITVPMTKYSTFPHSFSGLLLVSAT